MRACVCGRRVGLNMNKKSVFSVKNDFSNKTEIVHPSIHLHKGKAWFVLRGRRNNRSVDIHLPSTFPSKCGVGVVLPQGIGEFFSFFLLPFVSQLVLRGSSY